MSENIIEMAHKTRCLLRVLAVLFLEEPLFHFPFLLLDTFPTVNGAKVDEMQRVHNEGFLDLLVQLGISVKAWRMVHLGNKLLPHSE